MEGLKKSIERDGFIAPIVVRRRPKGMYEILSGNHRVMACRELGHVSIACVLVNHQRREVVFGVIIKM